MVKILTNFQKKLLRRVGESELSSYFIWSGGTALSYQYLWHRLSYDLDFLSKDLLPDEYLLNLVNQISKTMGVKKVEEHKRFNRYEFWLKKGKVRTRVEFVFYPFVSIKKPKFQKEFGLKIDSLEDILTNKIHAVFERSEPKDVFDVYCILQKKGVKFSTIFKWVKRKFGVEIDPVLFVSKILEGAEKLNKIKPIVLKKTFLSPTKIKNYFEKRAQDYLKKKIRR